MNSSTDPQTQSKRVGGSGRAGTFRSSAIEMLAVVETIAGLFFVAVLISRLVAMYSSVRPDGGDLSKPGEPGDSE